MTMDQPNKERIKCIRFTVGSNINYTGNISTKSAQVTTIKISPNSSILSTKDALFGTAYIKDFYLNTPLECYKFVAIPLNGAQWKHICQNTKMRCMAYCKQAT